MAKNKSGGAKPAPERKIYVNLPVKNLKKSMAFFTKLGFTSDPRFTNQKAACLIIGKNIYAMLLVGKFFKAYTKKKIADAAKSTEVIVALSAASRGEVDSLMRKALAAGATEPRKAEDYGWMYGRSFEDPDSHQWEIGYMDEAAAAKAMAKSKSSKKSKR
ncbi:MAG: VOC family protein [Candidatus Micrarchaeia archaeon]|jgi:hypothetical protein